MLCGGGDVGGDDVNGRGGRWGIGGVDVVVGGWVGAVVGVVVMGACDGGCRYGYVAGSPGDIGVVVVGRWATKVVVICVNVNIIMFVILIKYSCR